MTLDTISRSMMTRHEEAQLQARLERYRQALIKIERAWPCSEVMDMRRVAHDALYFEIPGKVGEG